MYLNFFKIGLRNFFADKTHSFINIFGFSTALSVVILLFLFVSTEIGADKFHENYDLLYRLQSQNGSTLPPVYLQTLKSSFPRIKQIARIRAGGGIVQHDNTPLFLQGIYYTDPAFVTMFSFKAIAGNLAKALNDPYSIVLTRPEAVRLFGTVDVLGKTLTLNGRNILKITAVLEDIPDNSSLHFSSLIPLEFLHITKPDEWNLSASNYEYYLLANSPLNAEEVETTVKQRLIENFPGWNLNVKYQLIPFSRIYFNIATHDNCRHGNFQQLMLLMSIGLFILVLAVINFVNLAIAKSSKRVLEIGIRKIVGADRAALIKQFSAEAIIICLISIGASLILVELMMPQFNTLFNTDISFYSVNPFLFAVMLILSGVVLGMLTGFYPAVYLTSLNPAKIMKSGKGYYRKTGTFKKGLILFQFSVSIVLIICSVVIVRQGSFLKNRKLGFNRENIIVLGYANNISGPFKRDLLSYPDINNVSVTQIPPGTGYVILSEMQWTYKGVTSDIRFLHADVDAEFLQIMGIKLKEGRLFSAKSDFDRRVCIINEAAVREFGIDDISQAGFDIFRNYEQKPQPAQVIGVVKDFNQESLHSRIRPFILFNNNDLKSGYTILKVKAADSGTFGKTEHYLEQTWRKYMPGIPFSYNFLDDSLKNLYAKETRIKKIFLTFSALAILIASFGLFGIVSFTSVQRTKEVGIRKVLGATVPGIIGLLTSDLTKLVLAANIIAWPVAYYAMTLWLKNYPYRIDLGWWMFILAGSLTLISALIAVCSQALKTALTNPAYSLRHE